MRDRNDIGQRRGPPHADSAAALDAASPRGTRSRAVPGRDRDSEGLRATWRIAYRGISAGDDAGCQADIAGSTTAGGCPGTTGRQPTQLVDRI